MLFEMEFDAVGQMFGEPRPEFFQRADHEIAAPVRQVAGKRA
jgi:hypothetical protein